MIDPIRMQLLSISLRVFSSREHNFSPRQSLNVSIRVLCAILSQSRRRVFIIISPMEIFCTMMFMNLNAIFRKRKFLSEFLSLRWVEINNKFRFMGIINRTIVLMSQLKKSLLNMLTFAILDMCYPIDSVKCRSLFQINQWDPKIHSFCVAWCTSLNCIFSSRKAQYRVRRDFYIPWHFELANTHVDESNIDKIISPSHNLKILWFSYL